MSDDKPHSSHGPWWPLPGGTGGKGEGSGAATIDGGASTLSVSGDPTPPVPGDPTPPVPGDGLVEGGAGADLIDAAYAGDPEGDRIDNGDALLPGAAPDDDLVLAGAGDDTVIAGAGDDEVFGGSGDDVADGGAGDDTLVGGSGADTLLGGLGDDLINGGGPDEGGVAEITFETEEADFRNAVGVYRIDPETGEIGAVHLAFPDASQVGAGGTLAGGETFAFPADAGAQIGVFLIADGAKLNDFAALGPGAFAFVNPDGSPATLASDAPRLVHIAPDGAQTDLAGAVYHSAGFGENVALNPDDKVHVAGIEDNGDGSFRFGFEDLPGLGDADFNDSVLTVALAPGTSLALPGTLAERPLDDGAGDLGDVIDGGAGDDTILGGAGGDTITGGADNDGIDGGAGEDVIDGGSGDDAILGGAGDDIVTGGAGADAITGAAGADVLLGRDDRDAFLGATAGDFIDGGEGGEDFDTLDLRGSGPLEVILDADNPENGVVNFFDGDRNVTGTATFRNIEKIVPCFTPGILIATPEGERAVETLRVGDKVVTRDNGLQEIRWIGHKHMDWPALAASPHLKPILIQQGALGNGLPERNMMVSPNHRLLVANDRTALYFDEHEVLVAAKHLVNHRGVHPIETVGTTYIHFMCDRHEVVLANGAWTESFQPGDETLKGMGNSQRAEIYELFPYLKTAIGRKKYGSVRKTLKRFEASLLGY